jgi:hypothetical protein
MERRFPYKVCSNPCKDCSSPSKDYSNPSKECSSPCKVCSDLSKENDFPLKDCSSPLKENHFLHSFTVHFFTNPVLHMDTIHSSSQQSIQPWERAFSRDAEVLLP